MGNWGQELSITAKKIEAKVARKWSNSGHKVRPATQTVHCAFRPSHWRGRCEGGTFVADRHAWLSGPPRGKTIPHN